MNKINNDETANTTQALTLGANYDDSGHLITCLDYTDDVVIFADLLHTLKDDMLIFQRTFAKTRNQSSI